MGENFEKKFPLKGKDSAMGLSVTLDRESREFTPVGV